MNSILLTSYTVAYSTMWHNMLHSVTYDDDHQIDKPSASIKMTKLRFAHLNNTIIPVRPTTFVAHIVKYM